jgi:hypothetical protein
MTSLGTANLLISLTVPAALAAIVLVIGVATANVPMIALAVVVGLLVGYLWIRRVRADETRRTK